MTQRSLFSVPPGDPAVAATCGMGVNSIAYLILLERQGIRPAIITMADTGGEHKRTYNYIPVAALRRRVSAP